MEREEAQTLSIRLPKSLHEALKVLAVEQRRSLNTFIVRVLEEAAKEKKVV